MAAVTPDERRILMDFFGYSAEAIDALPEYKAQRHLEAYYSQSKTGFDMQTGLYSRPPADEFAGAWVFEGLKDTAWDLLEGTQAAGEAIITTGRQVGVGIGETVQTTSKLLKYLVPAAIIAAGYVLFVRLKG